jgi:hypothetical protein
MVKRSRHAEYNANYLFRNRSGLSENSIRDRVAELTIIMTENTTVH